MAYIFKNLMPNKLVVNETTFYTLHIIPVEYMRFCVHAHIHACDAHTYTHISYICVYSYIILFERQQQKLYTKFKKISTFQLVLLYKDSVDRMAGNNSHSQKI